MDTNKKYPSSLQFCLIAITLLLAPMVRADDLRHPSSLNSFCVHPGVDHLCPDFPDDQTDFSDKFVYMLINVETQTPFDIFSWQAFTALNWDEVGKRAAAQSGWDSFRRREEVFGDDTAQDVCGHLAEGAEVITADLVQADGNVLIDQAGNFIVYETRLNTTAETYILNNALNTLSSQKARQDTPVDFPQGKIGDDPAPASVLIKTSWRIMPRGEDRHRFIERKGVIHVSAARSALGRDMCLQETLGLVGMHIVARIQSGNGDEWLWSTFEHKANAPTAVNRRQINSIYARDLFPGGCTGPADSAPDAFLFYRTECPDCPTNQAPDAGWKWAEHPPYARHHTGKVPTPSQIVRCWEVFEGTRELNEIWQAELQGTPLENYQLISTQWRGADKSPMFPHGEVPRFLTNTTLETYLQFDPDGSCLGCHAAAEDANGNSANFTFLLREAR